jgi:hypothetical protein
MDQRLVGLGLELVGDPVVDAERGQLFPQRFTVIALVGVVGLFIALDHRFAVLGTVRRSADVISA